MLFIASAVNYADRGALGAGQEGLGKHLAMDPENLSYIVAAWGWAYVLVQVPSGWLLDRFGARRVYGVSIIAWSLLILLQGTAGYFGNFGSAFLWLLVLNFFVGLAEAPAFPGNGRLVATWFPAKERGTASAIFNSSQYFSTVMFVPLMGWLAQRYGWSWVFWAMGAVGLAVGGVWFKTVYGPREHPWVSPGEVEEIEKGGALVGASSGKVGGKKGWFYVRQLLCNRMLVGVYIGQYCITTLTYFFVQWVMPYLIKDKQMSLLKAGFVAALPAVCGFAGGVLGGILSDLLLRRGVSLSKSRKIPIVLGMVAASAVVLCNYVERDWVVVAILCFAFFGKGLGALGWTVISDASPKEALGLCGGIFNMVGNSAQITLAYVVGSFVKSTGNFATVLLFVAGHAMLAIVAYTVVVGPIKRVELKEPATVEAI
jgi:MFS transporter, ACS family, glucarate transporter